MYVVSNDWESGGYSVRPMHKKINVTLEQREHGHTKVDPDPV